MRVFLCIFLMIILASCNTQTVKFEYPITVSSAVKVQSEDVEYAAEYTFSENKSDFIIREPSILNGLKVSLINDSITVSYNDIELSYDSPYGYLFGTFKDLHNILILMNETQPEFNGSGETNYCEIAYNDDIVSITADSIDNAPETIVLDKVKYDFD